MPWRTSTKPSRVSWAVENYIPMKLSLGDWPSVSRPPNTCNDNAPPPAAYLKVLREVLAPMSVGDQVAFVLFKVDQLRRQAALAPLNREDQLTLEVFQMYQAQSPHFPRTKLRGA